MTQKKQVTMPSKKSLSATIQSLKSEKSQKSNKSKKSKKSKSKKTKKQPKSWGSVIWDALTMDDSSKKSTAYSANQGETYREYVKRHYKSVSASMKKKGYSGRKVATETIKHVGSMWSSQKDKKHSKKHSQSYLAVKKTVSRSAKHCGGDHKKRGKMSKSYSPHSKKEHSRKSHDAICICGMDSKNGASGIVCVCGQRKSMKPGSRKSLKKGSKK